MFTLSANFFVWIAGGEGISAVAYETAFLVELEFFGHPEAEQSENTAYGMLSPCWHDKCDSK